MTKPSGVFEYQTGLLANNGVRTINPLVDDDIHGNHLGGQVPQGSVIEAYLRVISDDGGSAFIYQPRMLITPTFVAGLLTALVVQMTNRSLSGDLTAGIIAIRINHGENLAL